MGEHTRDILKDILGFSDEKMAALTENGCIK
jgi:crotonobetainyl-CoA:carnitine CoA-transferase CaiB-like acyl-CoA transferase